MKYETLRNENEKLSKENEILKSVEKDDFFNLSGDFLCTFFRRRFLQVNPAFVQALGYSKEYLLAHNIHEFLHPDDIDSTFQIILEYVDKEGDLVTQNRYRKQDGSYIMVSWKLYVKKNGVAYAVGRDITQQYALEQNIKQSEQLLKSIFNSNPSIFIIFDRNLKIIKINENAKRAIHFLIGAEIKKDTTFLEIFKPEVCDEMEARIKLVFEGETIVYERKMKHRFSSDTLWYQIMMTPLYLDREVIGVCYSANDISKHKDTEKKINELLENEKALTEELKTTNEELLQNIEEMKSVEEFSRMNEKVAIAAQKEAITNKERLQHIFDNLENHFFWVIEPKTERVTMLSKSFETILGYATKEIVTVEDAIQEIIYKDDLAILLSSYQDILQGKNVGNVEFRCLTPKGVIKWFSCQAKSYYEKGEIERIEGIVTDITANKEFETQLKNNITALEKTKKQLEYRNQELDTFIYKTSHDLRAPIRRILGLYNVLSLKQYEQETSQLLGYIQQSALQLNTALEELENIMHIKKLVVQKELINFEKIITEIQAELQNTPNYMLVRWDINIDVVSNFYTDIALFKTIVKNLAENSIKYARFYNNTPLIQLIIENKSANNMLSLTVMDNGQGIIKEQIPKIFDMFHRGTDNNSSIGLGLYTLKNALDKLHGTIDVKSIYGSGTTFTVQIPN